MQQSHKKGLCVKMKTPDAVNSIRSVAVGGKFERVSESFNSSKVGAESGVSTVSKIVGGTIGLAVGLLGGTVFGALRGAALGLTGVPSMEEKSWPITPQDELMLRQALAEGREVSWRIINGRGRIVIEFPAGDYILEVRRQLGPVLATLVGAAAGAGGCAVEFAKSSADKASRLVQRQLAG